MQKITILGLLLKYEKWLDNGDIQFLGKGTEGRKIVLNIVKDLISDFKKASENGGDISSNLDWHETHKKGRELWHELASYSLNYINRDSKGNSKLFEFLEAATEFEDLLYGLERYKTSRLHCY